MANWEERRKSVPGGLLDGLPEPVQGSGLRLLFGPLGGGGRSSAMTIGQVDPDALVLGRPDGIYLSAAGPKNPIGAVVGYPEAGKNSWRAGNDDVIVAAVNKYNAANGYFPGDAEYMTPQLAKAWVMRESGGHRHAFESDPLQVNNPRDYPKSGEKRRIAGLTYRQAMTPQTSAEAALKWLYYKGRIDAQGRLVPYQGHYEALRNYNAASGYTDGILRKSEYANGVLNHAWASYGDWQK